MKNGKILSTSCISVGGRLLSLNSDGKISHLNGPVIKVMQHIGLDYKKGDQIPEEDIEKITSKLAEALIEVMKGPANSNLAKQLMVTDNLDFTNGIDEIIFSGGVAEYIYGSNGNHDDIGEMLAERILAFLNGKERITQMEKNLGSLQTSNVAETITGLCFGKMESRT